jgi:urocanate reductase
MFCQNELNRREFIKDAAIIGTGAATACLLGACSSAPAAIPEKWDKETEIVVVGYGGAGACAAIMAREAGAEVLILEKLKTGGGNTAICGGVIYAGGTSVQKANKISDTTDKLYQHFLNAGKAFIDPALARIAADEAGKNIDWLIQLGAKFAAPVISGAEVPAGSDPIARVHTTRYGALSGGAAFYKVLADAAQAKGAKILFNTPGKQLIGNADGEVIGIRADSGGKEITIKARKAVVLTAGGFSRNQEMLAAYTRDGFYSPSLGVPGLTGDGIRMALALGADVSNMSKVVDNFGLILPGAERATYAGAGGIVVNILARRFVDETLFYDRKGIILLQQPEARAFSIFDEAYRKARGANIVPGFSAELDKEVATGTVKKANTLRALALHIKVPAAALEKTVTKWNEDAKAGSDSDWGRKTLLDPILIPPFYAYETFPVMFDTAGGVRINTKSQVVNVWGKIIPRLYAAGVNTGGLVGEFYPGSGAVLNGILTFGRIAGTNAAAEKPWRTIA